MEKITSRDNQFLKLARKIRDGRQKTHVFIEGKRLIEEAVQSGIIFEVLLVVEGVIDRDLLSFIGSAAELTYSIQSSLIDSVSDTKSPQGIIGIAKRPRHTLAQIGKSVSSGRYRVPVTIVLDEINNPSNLGAILRTAEAAGVAGVITTPHSTDAYSAKSIRASMGSAFRLPICEHLSMPGVLEFARENGLTPVVASADGTLEHTELDWKVPRLLIFGSEAHGIKTDRLDRQFESIKILIEEPVESLNLAVAAGIILFEAKRQNSIS